MRFIAWFKWFEVVILQVIAWLFFVWLSLYAVALLMIFVAGPHSKLIILCGPVVLAGIFLFGFLLFIKLTSAIQKFFGLEK
jgi:hypothetical protein